MPEHSEEVMPKHLRKLLAMSEAHAACNRYAQKSQSASGLLLAVGDAIKLKLLDPKYAPERECFPGINLEYQLATMWGIKSLPLMWAIDYVFESLPSNEFQGWNARWQRTIIDHPSARREMFAWQKLAGWMIDNVASESRELLLKNLARVSDTEPGWAGSAVFCICAPCESDKTKASQLAETIINVLSSEGSET